MSTSSASVFSLQSTIEKLLRATGRENVDQLLALMRDHGFYRVRCYKHHRYQGGGIPFRRGFCQDNITKAFHQRLPTAPYPSDHGGITHVRLLTTGCF